MKDDDVWRLEAFLHFKWTNSEKRYTIGYVSAMDFRQLFRAGLQFLAT